MQRYEVEAIFEREKKSSLEVIYSLKNHVL